MSRRFRSAFLSLYLSVAAAGLSACESDGGSGGADATGAQQAELKVTLTEWAIQTAQVVKAGPVRFIVENSGQDPHELVILRTDLSLDQLPRDADGGLVEEAEGIEMIGEVEDVDPGATKTGDFELAAGRYVLVCNIEEPEPSGEVEAHFGQGMARALTAE
jgi:hypothetical protein